MTDFPRRFRDRPVQPIILAVLECCCIWLAYLFAVASTLPSTEPFGRRVYLYVGYYVIFALVWCWVAAGRGLWGARRREGLATYLVAIVRAMAGALVFSVFVAVLLVGHALAREFLAVFFLATTASILLFRALFKGCMALLHRLGRDIQRILIVGANDRTAHFVDVVRRHPGLGYRIEGFIDSDRDRAEFLEKHKIPYLGGFEVLPQIIKEKGIGEVFITLPVRSLYDAIRRIAQTCKVSNVPVHLVADLFLRRIAKSGIMYMEDVPLLCLSPVPEERVGVGLKRLIDLMGSSILLVVLSPLFLLVALAIKLDSKGPAFFVQERVGCNQRRFKIVKFRSMVANAEELLSDLEDLNEADGPVFKIRNDPRITRVGRFIRKYSIDELPQLINVWLGHMSLVGPRPPIPAEVEKYTWDQRRRLSVKPGMTGLWQVSGRSDVGFEQWVEMDLQYIDSWSLWLDFIILLKTAKVVIVGKGAA